MGGQGRKVITGVRWAESVSRAKSTQVAKIMDKPSKVKKIAEEIGADVIETEKGGIVMADENTKSREMVEMCYRWSKTTINPIVDWSNSDVWEFLRYYGCDGNPLYHCGFHRIGCIGCPMAGKDRYREFELYPKYKQNYIKAFERMLEVMPNKPRWNTGEEVFRWWMEEDVNQIRFDDLQEEYDELMEEYL